MAKGGGKKRTYIRDGNGRFASSPGGGKPALKGGTLAKRSSLKGSRAKLKAKDKADPSIRNAMSTRAQKGAVTRGNKALRAAKASSQRTAVGRSKVGTLSKAKRSPVLKTTVLKPQAAKVPASQRPGSITGTLRATMGALAKADAQRIREIESITGQKVKPTAAGAKAGKEAGARVRATAKKGKVADTLRAGLRELAQSDARTAREMASIVRDATPKVGGGKSGKTLKGTKNQGVAAGKVVTPKAKGAPGLLTPVKKAQYERVAAKLRRQAQANNPLSGDLVGRANRAKTLRNREKRIATYLLSILAGNKIVKPASNPPTRAKGSKASLPRTRGTVAKPKGLKASPVNKEAAKPVKTAVQFRSRKQAAKAYKLKTNTLGNKTAASIGLNTAVKRRNISADSAPRLVFRRGKNQQITLSGGVETVKTGKMRQVGYRNTRGAVKMPLQSRRRKFKK